MKNKMKAQNLARMNHYWEAETNQNLTQGLYEDMTLTWRKAHIPQSLGQGSLENQLMWFSSICNLIFSVHVLLFLLCQFVKNIRGILRYPGIYHKKIKRGKLYPLSEISRGNAVVLKD